MRGTVTATGRTFAVAVPTLRREQTGNGREQNCDPRKSEESQAKPLDALMGKFEQVSYSGIDVFLDPAWWNRGVGTQLIRALRGHLCNQGAAWVVVDPRVDNPRAVRSYQKAGFAIIRRLEQHEWHEGRWHDAWLMAAGCEERSRT